VNLELKVFFEKTYNFLLRCGVLNRPVLELKRVERRKKAFLIF